MSQIVGGALGSWGVLELTWLTPWAGATLKRMFLPFHLEMEFRDISY